MSYFVYVITSQTRKYRYIGISDNVQRRLQQHNNGYNKTTKPYIPFKIILVEKLESRHEARTREKFLKSGVGREFLDNLS